MGAQCLELPVWEEVYRAIRRARGECTVTAPPPRSERESGRRDWNFNPHAKKYREQAGGAMYAMQWLPRLEKIMTDGELPLVMRFGAFLDLYCNGNLSHCAVDGMPQLEPSDRIPRKLSCTDVAALLRVSPAGISAVVRNFRERKLLLPGTEDGGLYTDHSVQPGLFSQASQRENGDVNPLDSAADSGSEDPLLEYGPFAESWLIGHPEVREDMDRLVREREELRRQAQERSEDLNEHKRRILTEWRNYKRARARAARTENPHSAEGSSGSINKLPEQSVHDSTHYDDIKASTVNKTADIISKEKTTPSSSSGCRVTDSTTTPVAQTLKTEPNVDSGVAPIQAAVIPVSSSEVISDGTMDRFRAAPKCVRGAHPGLGGNAVHGR
jgi:hypothetical protein